MRPFSCLFVLVLSLQGLVLSQTFQRTRSASPKQPADIFVNDLNGDGKPDIITANYYAQKAFVYLNRGNGTFPANPSAVLPINRYALAVNSADYDGDGKQDVAIMGDSQGDPPGYIYIYLGNGDGTFRAPVINEVMFAPEAMGYLHATRNGKLDLAFAVADGYIQIMYNAGGGKFVEGPHILRPTGGGLWGLSTGDYNRDGLSDMVALVDNPNSGTVRETLLYMFLNNGDGTFTTKLLTTVYGAAINTQTVDVNGDGIPDLLVPFILSSKSANGVRVLINNGDGSSWTSRILALPSNYSSGAKAAERDLTGDGLHDIVLPVTNSNSTGRDAVAVFPAISRTSWGAPKLYPVNVGDDPHAAAVGDFNRDRRTDFATVNMTSGSVDVFLNTSGCVPPGTSPAVSICSPARSATVGSPVTVKATARWDGKVITHMRAYIDNVPRCDASNTAQLQCSVPLAKGSYKLTINVWNSAGQLATSAEMFSVQ